MTTRRTVPSRGSLFGALVGLLWLCASTRTSAEDAPQFTATVVALDGDQLVLDVSAREVRPGAVLRLYRTLTVKHPVTGKALRDRFPNGTLQIVQAGDTLSIARTLEAPSRPAAVGDAAELDEPAPPVRTAGEAESARVVAVQREILETWYATLGKPPEARLVVLRKFLVEHPASPYRSWLESEIAFYESGAFADTAKTAQNEAVEKALSEVVHTSPLEHALAGAPLMAGVYVPPETKLRRVKLWLRANGKAGEFRAVDLPLDARGQGHVEVPASFVRAPGFAYFYEAYFDANRSIALRGSSANPSYCDVARAEDGARRVNMSRVRFATEYVSFDGLSGRDYYYLFEADFLLRLPTRYLEGVRVGYGHYRGRGGTVEELDELGISPAPAAFTYGYLEVVLALHELFAVMPRLEVGLGRPVNADNDKSSQVRGGGQLRLRIGRADGTHLILAGETVPEIGQRAFVGLTLGLLEHFPIAFEVHVTDQPVNTDELGVRAVFEFGYRVVDVFSLSARASYQGRTIDHTGPGLGLAATFDW